VVVELVVGVTVLEVVGAAVDDDVDEVLEDVDDVLVDVLDVVGSVELLDVVGWSVVLLDVEVDDVVEDVVGTGALVLVVLAGAFVVDVVVVWWAQPCCWSWSAAA
jgi:hypothetical protein